MHPLPNVPAVPGFTLSPALARELLPNLGTAQLVASDLLSREARGTLERIRSQLWQDTFSGAGLRPYLLTDHEHEVLTLAMCIVAGWTHIPVDCDTYGQRIRRSAAHCLAELTGPHSPQDLADWGREEREYAKLLLEKHAEKGGES